MHEDDLQRMQLPGYWAFAHHEPISWYWVGLWLAWGVGIAGICVWRDQAYAVAGGFVAYGIFMSSWGWKTIVIGCLIISDRAKHHFTDPKVEEAACREMFKALEDWKLDNPDDDNFLLPDTPLQSQSTQQDLFAMLFSTPWMMGLVHGLGVGGVLGMLMGLIPDSGVDVSTGAMFGAAVGAVCVASISALVLALYFGQGCSFSFTQRLLLLVSPLIVAPLLFEAAVIWGRWFLRRRRHPFAS